MIERMTTDRDLDRRELTVEQLDATTGGALPEGFMSAVKLGMLEGWLEAGGTVTLGSCGGTPL